MRIKDILSGNLQKINRSRGKDDGPEKAGSAKEGEAGSKAQRSDSTSISAEARDLQQAAQLISESVDALKAMPDVRVDVVARAKERVASGYYDSPEVLNHVANIIGEHIAAESPVSSSDLATDIIANISPENANLTQRDLSDIRSNLEKGLYQDEDVIQDVAEKIYQFLGDIKAAEE